jgi:hypothetical protein
VCHQTVSLVARHLEQSGIPTLVIGSAHDIVAEAGVARFLFVDFPLGNPCGPPDDPNTQRSIIELALRVADGAIAARTVVQAPVSWPSQGWRDNYMRVGDDNRDALRKEGNARRARSGAAKSR